MFVLDYFFSSSHENSHENSKKEVYDNHHDIKRSLSYEFSDDDSFSENSDTNKSDDNTENKMESDTTNTQKTNEYISEESEDNMQTIKMDIRTLFYNDQKCHRDISTLSEGYHILENEIIHLKDILTDICKRLTYLETLFHNNINNRLAYLENSIHEKQHEIRLSCLESVQQRHNKKQETKEHEHNNNDNNDNS